MLFFPKSLYSAFAFIKFSMKTITISEEEYKRLKEKEKVDSEILEDIARGVKDILTGKVKEI